MENGKTYYYVMINGKKLYFEHDIQFTRFISENNDPLESVEVGYDVMTEEQFNNLCNDPSLL